ncbi:adenosine kinase [Aphanothece hegewaldii CCALA 016]|uniref:Adenosine kinase n=1 Tax=Aphanothece hegewaldii CCALA 016 TaxID=2107694 RepID=A0A2T1LTR3_9CHRO|nr:adenosine kinase [Aphanothece hegewaldii]PSF34491.1 adenosine kinase [Aphanothece hegewaldii CCALA 016]
MSKKYHVYGVGNALVDMEFEVTPEILQELKIDKGVMTLVDESRQAEIVVKLTKLHCKRCSGGSAANTMVAISQLGGKGFYSCKVANDETGSFYLEDLINCGLDTNLRYTDRESGTTGKCIVMVTPDADRTMNTFLGITGTLSTSELVPDAIADSEYIYLEGYLVTSATGKNAAIKAREIAMKSGVKTSLSLSDPNMASFFKNGLLEMIGDGIDLIFANETEAMKLANSHNINDAIAYLKTLSKCFAMTRGANGSIIFDGENLLEIAPVPVQAVDTVGAGDMYAGAFLYGITHGMSDRAAGNLASLAASRIVSRFGARLATEEMQDILNGYHSAQN